MATPAGPSKVAAVLRGSEGNVAAGLGKAIPEGCGLVRKASVHEEQVSTPAKSLLREATTPVRAAKAMRSGEVSLEEALEEIMMESVDTSPSSEVGVQEMQAPAASSVSAPAVGERPSSPLGEIRDEAPAAAEPESALSLACFRTRASRMAPAPGQAACRLLKPLPVDTARRVYGIPSVEVATSGWHAPWRRFGGIRNHGNTCFVNATVQVLSRVEGFVRCLRMHTHVREPAEPCVLCALRDQIETLRAGVDVQWSEVALLARAGRLDEDFRGDATTGAGEQCDSWDCLLKCVQTLNQYESDRLESELRDCPPEQREGVGERRVVFEHVCGMLFRNRVRCAQCTAVSDTLDQFPHAELDMRDNLYTSLKDLWQHHVTELRGERARCPDGCGANAYSQRFLEREPPVLLFRLKRFYQESVRGVRRDRKDPRRVDFPEVLDFMRSGEYHFAATLQHEGPSLNVGHYVATVWEGAEAGVDRYREYRDDIVGESVAWDALPFQRLKADAYVLVYVRTRFWSDTVGDGSERTPYLRDRMSLDVAGRYFRGRPALMAPVQGVARSSGASVVDGPSEGASGAGAGSSVSRPSLLQPRAVRASRVVSLHDANPLETEARRDVEATARARRRVEEGERGRAVDFDGQDLDRSAGGPSRPLG